MAGMGPGKGAAYGPVGNKALKSQTYVDQRRDLGVLTGLSLSISEEQSGDDEDMSGFAGRGLHMQLLPASQRPERE